MGMLDMIKEFIPFNMQPPGSLNNPQTQQSFRVAQTYANPEHFTFWRTFGPYTPAAVDRLSGKEYLQQRGRIFANNAQIVSVPERPVDAGTWKALVANNNLHYLQPNSGVYLQGAYRTSGQAVAGNAPTKGIYTGLQTTAKTGWINE